MSATQLIDRFGRVHDYLRLSLTDKCNLRCTYCMPEHPDFLPERALMKTEELLGITDVFVQEFGVRKVRMTGGEPTLHKDFASIVRHLSSQNIQLALTTNGILLDRYVEVLKDAGMKSINISLDSLRRERVLKMTRRDSYETVMRNIELALDAGFHVKLNAVIMRGENEDEVADFVRLSKARAMHIRFIEFMPFDGNRWEWEKVVPASEMLEGIRSEFEFEKLDDKPESTSRAYQLKGASGTFAFISTVSHAFCSGCNRIRLTADGKMRNCLFGQEETDLLQLFRAGQDLKSAIIASIQAKHKELGGLPDFREREKLQSAMSTRAMVKIGG